MKKLIYLTLFVLISNTFGNTTLCISKEYPKLLSKISFSKKTTLFICGDNNSNKLKLNKEISLTSFSVNTKIDKKTEEIMSYFSINSIMLKNVNNKHYEITTKVDYDNIKSDFIRVMYKCENNECYEELGKCLLNYKLKKHLTNVKTKEVELEKLIMEALDLNQHAVKIVEGKQKAIINNYHEGPQYEIGNIWREAKSYGCFNMNRGKKQVDAFYKMIKKQYKIDSGEILPFEVPIKN